MLWYYVRDGKQEGPVEEEALAALVSSGQVQAETLVWHEGMTDWQPCAQAAPRIAATSLGGMTGGETTPAVSSSTRCSLCGRVEYPENLILVDGQYICADCKPDFAQRLAEQGDLPDHVNFGMAVHYGGFWIRVVASIVDSIVISIVTVPLGLLANLLVVGSDNPGIVLGVSMLANLLQISIAALYEILMLGAYGATLGKMACGLRVVMADGSPISYGRATGRHFAKYLSQILLGIGYVIAAFDDQKRTLHDHICNTRVIYRT